MRADYLTYQKATSLSFQGLAVQALLAVATLIYGVLARDQAAFTASAYMGVGAVIWLALAIVYDQHRRERIEAIEVEAMAKSPTAGSSVFEAQDEFRPAARRLATLHKYFVPSLSGVVGLLLVGIGVLRFVSARDRIAPHQFVPALYPAWGLGLGLVTASLGFIIARYAAGMGKQEAWANLRAGASAAVGTAVLGVALAGAHFLNFMRLDVVARYLPAAVAVFMVLIGAEVFLNFVLGVYRPRKAGEVPRPAFDSRLLGLMAAPDRIAQSISDAINYQLGFDVTRGWFYRLISRWFAALVAVCVLVKIGRAACRVRG